MVQKIGWLLLHGFGGSIEEILPLIRYLEEKGCMVVAPKLAGHTGRRGDLAKVTYSDWVDSGQKAYIHLQNQCDRIVIVGFSMGALIGCHLAVKNKVEALVVLNMPIYYWDFKQIARNLKEDLRAKKCDYFKDYIHKSVNKPLISLVHFRILLSMTKKLLNRIQCPLFVAQALNDDTVQHKSAKYIYERVASRQKAIKFYDDAGHLICHSIVSKQVFDDLYAFITENVKI